LHLRRGRLMFGHLYEWDQRYADGHSQHGRELHRMDRRRMHRHWHVFDPNERCGIGYSGVPIIGLAAGWICFR